MHELFNQSGKCQQFLFNFEGELVILGSFVLFDVASLVEVKSQETLQDEVKEEKSVVAEFQQRE